MGLDIYVNKIVKEVRDDYFKLIDEDGNYRNRFPAWTKKFENEVTEEWYDWKKFKEETGIDVYDCQWISESYGPDGAFMEVWPNEFGEEPQIEDFKTGEDEYDFTAWEAARNAHIIKIDLDKVPMYEKKVKVLYYEEVGYQRKGLNSKFYSDYRAGEIGYFVWKKAELIRYKRDYCDNKKEYIYPNGESSGSYLYPKRDFQRNIIDNFGKHCCATFSW